MLITGTHLQSDRVLLILETLAGLINRGQDAKLVIAGRLAWPDGDKETREAIQQFKLSGNVELTGSYTQDQAQESTRRRMYCFTLNIKIHVRLSP